MSFNRFCPFLNLQQFSIIILTLFNLKYAIVIVCRVVEKDMIHHPLNLNKVIENRGSYSFLTRYTGPLDPRRDLTAEKVRVANKNHEKSNIVTT